MAATASLPVGSLLREWRQRRRLSQLDLAVDANISARHLSFIETGRARPSRDMILQLADQLEVPLRERNLLLTAGGFAQEYTATPLPDLEREAAWNAVRLILTGHEPYPAIAIDRHWTLLAANRAVGPLLAGIAPALLEPPVNVLRLSLHPDGLAPRIRNAAQWRAHLFHRLRQQIEQTADRVLIALVEELQTYPSGGAPAAPKPTQGIVVPLEIDTPAGVLSLISTTMVFGTPIDITLSELAIESFFPANEASAAMLRG